MTDYFNLLLYVNTNSEIVPFTPPRPIQFIAVSDRPLVYKANYLCEFSREPV